MLLTYKAKITNNKITWLDEVPENINNDEAVLILVNDSVNHQTKISKNEKTKILSKLEKLASRINQSEIIDPIEWQRMIRKDRKLPGRISNDN